MLGGPSDGFLGTATLNLMGNNVTATFRGYVGGAGDDILTDVIRDRGGNLLLGGGTQSPTFPGLPPAVNGNGDGILLKVAPTLDRILAGIRVGGLGADRVNRLGQDPATNRLFLAGQCGTDNWLPRVPRLRRGGNTLNGFVAEANQACTGLVGGLYLGGSGVDNIRDLELGGPGQLFLAGTTNSTDLNIPLDSVGSIPPVPNALPIVVSTSRPGTFQPRVLSMIGADGNEVGLKSLPLPGALLFLGSTASRNFPQLHPFMPGPTDNQNGFLTQVQERIEVNVTGSLDFGRLRAGQVATKEVKVKNMGPADVLLGLRAPGGSPLEVEPGELTVAPGATRGFRVRARGPGLVNVDVRLMAKLRSFFALRPEEEPVLTVLKATIR